jgi:hypothetical protein
LALPAADAYDPALFGHMVKMNAYRRWLAACFFFLVDELRGVFFTFFLSPPCYISNWLGAVLILLTETVQAFIT